MVSDEVSTAAMRELDEMRPSRTAFRSPAIGSADAACLEQGFEPLLHDVMVRPARGLPVAFVFQQGLVTLVRDGVVGHLGGGDPAYGLTPKAQRMSSLPLPHALAKAVGVATLMGCATPIIVIGIHLAP